LNQILSEATGQPIEKVQRDVDRDYIMNPRQALEYGMIDRVITRRELPGNAPAKNDRPLNGTGH
jgi:ATP-dependent Clp protease protease subunit